MEGSLPNCEPDGRLTMEPVAVLERRLGKVNNSPVTFVLVEWQTSQKKMLLGRFTMSL